MKIFLLLLALAALASVGCGATEGSSDRLRKAVIDLNEGVRWGRVEEILPRVDPPSHGDFLANHDGFGKDIKVTNYEITSTMLTPDGKAANIGVKIEWYRVNEMEVHETVLVQIWEERGRDWLLIAEEYRAGTPF